MVERVLGEIPADWEYSTLGEVCTRGGGGIQTGPFGSQLHASDYVSQGIPSVMPENIGDNRIIEKGIARILPKDAERLSRYLLREGDIVYSRRGDVEKRALVRATEDGWLCGTGCLRVRFGSKGVDPRFAAYYLGHPSVREWVVRHAHGATMPNLNTSIIGDCPFVAPPQADQRAVAAILGALDDKIELNRRMNETLEASARALFKSWFVDFDPVCSKTSRLGDTKMIHLPAGFPNRLANSQIGEIPQGWNVGTLADFADLNPESWTKETAPDSVEYVDLSNTKWGHIEEVQSMRWEIAPSRAQRILRKGDTIVGTVRPGNGSYALVGEDGLTGSSGFAVLRPRKPAWRLFVYLRATDRDNIARLAHLADGGAYPAVHPEVVYATQTACPPETVLSAFARIADVTFAKIESAVRESRTLASLRDTLLPKLISGALRIKDAERFVAGG